MSILVKISTKTPDPRMALMHPAAAPLFEQLRKDTLDGSGVDFLAECGDVLRAPGFISTKEGVAYRSWHKTGRAFDYNQSAAALVITGETIAGKQFFRTYLRCSEQDGSPGKKLRVKDYRGFFVNAYLFDFTTAAEDLGFKRIPAWNGWQKSYNRREFWHYQFDQGLTWAAAMADLASSKPASVATANKLLGLNDRGDAVRKLQTALNKRGLLAAAQIDGVFGKYTKAAVEMFQAESGLAIDGVAGPKTLKALEI